MRSKEYNEMSKLMAEMKKYRSRCECGWMVTVTNKHQREICPRCGRYVYSNKHKFKEKLKKVLRGKSDE